jgi:hypothetical protein
VASPYDIAIKISMENAVSPVMALIAKDMLGLSMSAKELEKSFARMGAGMKLALGAGVIAGAGAAAIGVALDLAKHGEKLLHQQNVMLRNGQSFAEVTSLTADAFDRITRAVPTATGSDALRTISELRSVLGDTDAAVKQAPFALKLDAILGNLTGKDSEGSGFALWRALEMKGMTVSDPAGASKLAETMAQIIGASNGKVDANQYQAFAKRGGAAWMAASPHFIAGAGSVAIGDMGGDTAGTAYSTLYNGLMGATQMSRQQIDAYRTAGLLDESKVHKIKGSSNVQMDVGAIKGVQEYSKDLDQWVANTMAPAFHDAAKKIAEKQGISEDSAYDSLIAKAGRNKNTQRLMHMWGDPEFIEQIDKDRALWQQAQGIDPAYGTMLGDPGNKARGPSGRMSEAADAVSGASTASRMADYTAVMKAMQAQWESMLQAIGGPVAAGMIPIMKGLTTEFNTMGAAAIAHGDDIHKIMDAVVEPLKGLASILITIGPPIAKGAQELDDFLNSIVAFENKLGATTHAFLKSFGIDIGAGSKPYDPLSSIHPRVGMKTTPSGIALSGGTDNAKVAAASAMPVNLPPANITAPLSGPAKVTTGPITISISGQSIVAALASEITAKIEGMFRNMGASGTNGDSGHDGRASAIYPDHMHGSH